MSYPVHGRDSIKVLRRFSRVILIICLGLFGVGETAGAKTLKELPVLVTVAQLLAQPDQYDGHRVVVTGRIRSAEMQRGLRGSEFLILVLEENSTTPSNTVQVYSPSIPPVKPGDRALVQGVYYREGRQGGRPFENFIDSEIIVPDKP